MIEHKKVAINLPEIKEYADIGNIKQELEIILKYCDRASQINEDENENWLLIDSLVTAGIVRYTRIFHSGKRLSLKIEDITGMEEELVAHNYVLNLRNKFVAHSVNEYERSTLVAFIELENNRLNCVSGIANEPARVIFNKNNAWALEQLTKKVKNHVENILLNQYDNTLSKVRNQSEEFLLSCLPNNQMTINPQNVNTARK